MKSYTHEWPGLPNWDGQNLRGHALHRDSQAIIETKQ